MTSAFESAISEVMADLDQQRNDLVRLHENLDRITGTARSRRRQVSVTVDARGEIIELNFHGEGYKSMPAADLARTIVETIQDAKQSAQAQLWEALGDHSADGQKFAQTAMGNHDWSSVLDDTMTLPKPLMDLLNHAPSPVADIAAFNAMFAAMSGQGGDADDGNAAAARHRAVPDQRQD